MRTETDLGWSATVLKRGLDEGARLIADGERSGAKIAGAVAAAIQAEGLTKLDYAACVDTETLDDAAEVDGPVLLAVAAWVGKARLIDNMTLYPVPPKAPGRGPDERASIRKG